MIQVSFQINKLHLCKPLIRAIDSLPMKDKFSLSHLITFRYANDHNHFTHVNGDTEYVFVLLFRLHHLRWLLKTFMAKKI